MTLRSPPLAEIQPGDALPELRVPLTSSLIVAGAIASRDFTPVHHDKAAAQAAGMQDVFMNILTTEGWVCRFVTDWAGPDARVRKLSLKLGAPNLPGDAMVMTGSVQSKQADGVTLEVVGKNAWGNHVTAKVELSLPRQGQP
jgi:acyl dehydratase